MKRFTLLVLLSSAAAFAASRAETTTYVDGNVAGISPNTGGTLLLSEEKAMYFRTGLTNIAVPYSGIGAVELGAVKETAHSAPIYKVWKLRERLSGRNKTETQLLIVSFKNDEGEEKSMTLELAEESVQPVLSALEERTGKTFAADRTQAAAAKKAGTAQAKNQVKSKDGEWWGDDYWKTPRNADKWNKTAGSNNNNR